MTLAAPALQPDHVLEQRYFDRMASSLGDKARILPFVRGFRVLDVGAGGGELARAIAAHCHHVTALDNTPDAIERLRNMEGVSAVLEGSADQLPELHTARFSTIVVSAIMHEVYSYGTSTGLIGHPAVARTYHAFRESLVPGGRLIIRDGVMPDQPWRPASVRVPDDDLVREYLAMSPHPELDLADVGGGLWRGTRHAVSEMLLTVTWGRDSFPRETQERYELFTADGYVKALSPWFEPVHVSTVTQREYVTNLTEYDIRDENDRPWFPPTNGLWVFDHRGD